MAARIFIDNGQTTSAAMSLDWDGCLVTFLFFDGAGLPVAVSGLPSVSRSLYDTGDIFQAVQPFATNEWRFNGPCSRVRVSLVGVTGFSTYRVLVWRTDDPLPMIPDGAFTGLRAIITQPYTEANVKNGLQFNLRAAWPILDPIATGTTRKIHFRTNAKPVIVKLREVQYLAEELILRLFQGPTGVTGGTPLTIHNYNGVNPVASTATATKNVTTTTDGTPFDNGDPEYFFGGSNDPQRQTASIPAGRERILPANTDFLVTIQNSGGGNARVQYFLDYYEGGTDIPIKTQ